MQRPFSLILICFIFLSLDSLAQVTKKQLLCIEVLEKASDFSEIKKVIHIASRYPDAWQFIPSIHPIAEQNKPFVSSNYGRRTHPITKKKSHHTGVDFVAEYATTIHATAAGEVIYANKNGGYGKCLIIRHKYGFETLYAHLTEYYKSVGDLVAQGDIIAFLGNTGRSTGAHLHYEVIKNGVKINPYGFINIKQ